MTENVRDCTLKKPVAETMLRGGCKVKCLLSAQIAVLFPETMMYKDVLANLNALRRHLLLRIKIEQERRKKAKEVVK